MSAPSIRRNLTFSFGTLLRDAQRLYEALQDNPIGAPVVSRLPATFVADFAAQIALAVKLAADKSGAVGTLGALTNAQKLALADYLRLASVARRAATLAFPGEATLLRNEFMVGVQGPKDLASILDRARLFVVACQRYATALALHTWPEADTAELQAAVAALASVSGDQGTAADAKLGATAQRLAATTTLYRQCLLVQAGARKVYGKAQVAADASLVEGRARFLLDEFPPRASAVASSTPAPAAAPPAAPVPAGT